MHTCATANSFFQVWPNKVGVKIITDGPLIKNDGTTWIWGLKCSMEGCFQNPGEDQTSWFWEFWREPVSDPTWTFMSCSVSYFTQFVKLTLLIYEWNSSNQMTKVKFLFHCTTYRELSLYILIAEWSWGWTWLLPCLTREYWEWDRTPFHFLHPQKSGECLPRRKSLKVILVGKLCPRISFCRIWSLTKSFLQILVDKHKQGKIEKGLRCVTF